MVYLLLILAGLLAYAAYHSRPFRVTLGAACLLNLTAAVAMVAEDYQYSFRLAPNPLDTPHR